MKLSDRLQQRWPKDWPLQVISPVAWTEQRPTYGAAQPRIINAALARSQRRPTGNWYVIADSRAVRPGRPHAARVADIELVAWRDRHGGLVVGPGSCPHLGAELATGTVREGVLFCRWHGLALEGNSCKMGWAPYPSYDDGVLAWVRLDAVGKESPLAYPVLPDRPKATTLPAVTRTVGACEAPDIIANRLDPWHGGWFHPYSFTRLEVLTTPTDEDDRFLVSVTFRVGRFGVPTIAEFTCPEARTIVMRIVEGEGSGSVVETHATPIGHGPDGRPRVAVIEATIAHSQRTGFKMALNAAPLIRPLMRYAANRLWRDDLVYAERLYHLRSGSDPVNSDQTPR